MSRIILLNKPFRVLSQFTDREQSAAEPRATLADYLSAPGFRVAGRLDYDSEGLVVLTDDGRLQQQIANPRHKRWKTYWVQVEGQVSDEAIHALRSGVELKDGPTRPAKAQRLEPPEVWPRTPPVRYRANVPDTWLQVALSEGRNRQLRRMTAAVGHPTLRLIRVAVGDWQLDGLQPGEYRYLDVPSPEADSRAAVRRPAARTQRGARSHSRRSHTTDRHRSSSGSGSGSGSGSAKGSSTRKGSRNGRT